LEINFFQNWLGDVERAMVNTLIDRLTATKAALKKSKRDKWLKDFPGQTCITSSQIQWTGDTIKALKQTRDRGDKKALKSMKKKQVSFNRYCFCSSFCVNDSVANTWT